VNSAEDFDMASLPVTWIGWAIRQPETAPSDAKVRTNDDIFCGSTKF